MNDGGGNEQHAGVVRVFGDALDQYTSVCEKPRMILFSQPENHEWSLDGIGEVLGSIVVESDLEAMKFCYRPELWDAKFLVCLSEDKEIVGRCHLDYA